MSGGAFKYIQHNWDLKNSIDAIDNAIKERGYSHEVIFHLSEAKGVIEKAMVYLERVDFLLSGDDGEESFLERLKTDLSILNH